MTPPRDESLSDEDLDLRTMTEEELYAYWELWLQQAQATNDVDRYTYSHGVFVSAAEAPSRPAPALPPASSAL